MAPENKKHRRKRKRRSSCKCKQVKFSERVICVPPSPMSLSTATTASSETAVKNKPLVFENKILHYLWKLTNYLRAAVTTVPQQAAIGRENAKDSFQRFHADTRNDRVNKNVAEPMVPQPDKYTSKNSRALKKRSSSSNPKLPVSKTFDPKCASTLSRKAYDIVRAAIQYGLANRVILEKGKYFCITKENFIRPRRSPTPDYDLREHHHTCPHENDATKSVCSYKEPSKTSPSQPSTSQTAKSVSQNMKSYGRKSENNPARSCPTKKIVRQTQNRKAVKSRGNRNGYRAKIRSTARFSSISRSRSRSRPRSFRVATGGISVRSLPCSTNSSGFNSVSQSPPRKKQKKVKGRGRRKHR